jgi:hypothetical protein
MPSSVRCIAMPCTGGGVQGREREGGDESEGCQQGSLRLPRHQGLPGSSGWPQVLPCSMLVKQTQVEDLS